MKIGITVGLGARAETTLDGLAGRMKEFESRGFATVWMANAAMFDAMTALAVVGPQTSRIELGTAVVPTYPRHPVVMAQQALTAQAALEGRFTLGIGVSHEQMMTDGLGIPYERPARHMREYLSVLLPLLEGKPVSVSGDVFQVEARLAVDAARVPVVLAAMGPVMLRLAGSRAEGTITSWVGPRTLETHIAPRITQAAEAAGRRPPRIIAGLPIALTGDGAAAREHLSAAAAFYYSLPTYRAMFDLEGVAGPADVALFGDEAELDAELGRLADAGATELAAQIVRVEPGSIARTLDYLESRRA